MKTIQGFITLATLTLTFGSFGAFADEGGAASLSVGAARMSITPVGPNPYWKGGIGPNGVWGERFQDTNGNGIWDSGEPYENDPANTALDKDSDKKYDGIYLAGFGNGRLAKGMHDEIYATAVVVGAGSTKIAFVTLDLLGYFNDGSYYGLKHVAIDPALGITKIILSSTHNHQAPDPIGPWGAGMLKDGKYPLYLKFVDQMIGLAVEKAARQMVPARAQIGATNSQQSPELAGMQTRTQGRPPEHFDDSLHTLVFRDLHGGTVATIVNWATHPESLEDENTLITSDFPGAVRAEIEAKMGGITLYQSGALGSVEIIGDSNLKPTDRQIFDGKEFPYGPNGSRPAYTFERTTAIGKDVAKAALRAIQNSADLAINDIKLQSAPFQSIADNKIFDFLASVGVLDVPFANIGGVKYAQTEVNVINLGDLQMITVPGELFPEVWDGLAQYKRNDCPAADTGREIEGNVRSAMRGKYQWIVGLSPDEFGYIIPGYDFRAPKMTLGIQRAKDACSDKGVPDHYHEINSGSSFMAKNWVDAALGLLK